MIVWNETMSTGVAKLDAQHKMLFQRFNELSDVITTFTAREAASEMLDFLQFYASWHFRQEEDCMDEYRCPVAAENKDAHAKFREQFGSFYQEWQSGNLSPTLAEETYKELENWLLYHIARTDTRLRSCVIK